MTTPLITNNTLSRTLTTAVLLTGGMAAGEAAIQHAIRSLGSNAISPDELFESTLAAAVQMRWASLHGKSEEADQTILWLPSDLRPLLYLRRELRHCFVLRILAGLCRERCAEVLDMQPFDVDRNASAAAAQLASMVQSTHYLFGGSVGGADAGSTRSAIFGTCSQPDWFTLQSGWSNQL